MKDKIEKVYQNNVIFSIDCFALYLFKFSPGVDELNINRYTAKIGYANEKSLNMFKKFGFQEVSI